MNTSFPPAFLTGPTEWIIVLVVVILLFGPKKLPDLSRAIGKSIGEFKRGRKEIDEELQSLKEETESGGETDKQPEQRK